MAPSPVYGAVGGTFQKLTNGMDCEEAPNYILVGDPVTFEYVFTNTSDEPLINVSLTDSVLGTLASGLTLGIGEDYYYSIGDTAVEGDYFNSAEFSVEGETSGVTVIFSDPGCYTGVNASLDIEKYTNGQDADAAPGPYIAVGNPVTWTYVVINTGDVDLDPFYITDDGGVTIECPSLFGFPLSLDAGEAVVCTATGTAQAGQQTNTATAYGWNSDARAWATDSDASNYFGEDLSVDLEFHTEDEDADSPTGPYVGGSDLVSFEYFVVNTGNVTVDVDVVDDDLGPVCTISGLDPGESDSCSDNELSQSGQQVNRAVATATANISGNTASDTDYSHYFGESADLDVEKYTNWNWPEWEYNCAFVVVGEEINWQYWVYNGGNVPVTNIELWDFSGVEFDDGMEADDIFPVDCPKETLQPGEAMYCYASGTLTEGMFTEEYDGLPVYINVAEVAGTAPSGEWIYSSWDEESYSCAFGVTPEVTLEKYTGLGWYEDYFDADEAPGPYTPAGWEVHWEYQVTNTGNVDLYCLEVTDD